jgi:putative phage-type endonuclease
MEQRSQEWLEARCGSLGASQVADALAKTKTGWGASRANLIAQLVCERLTGQPTEGYTNAAMQWGVDKEPEALALYEFEGGAPVERIGLAKHPHIAWTHASPDGLVGERGLVEVKCPNTATHLDTLLGQSVPGKYITQMQWQMAVTERDWCDFVSYDPRLPADLRMFVQRVGRDHSTIIQLEQGVIDFLSEVDAKLNAIASLRRKAA